MADVTMNADLVRIDVLGNVDRVARNSRKSLRNARRAMGLAVANGLARVNAKINDAARVTPKSDRRTKRLVFVLAFLAIGFLFLQTGILNAFLSLPFAIFG
jgi:hypothetical protein